MWWVHKTSRNTHQWQSIRHFHVSDLFRCSTSFFLSARLSNLISFYVSPNVCNSISWVHTDINQMRSPFSIAILLSCIIIVMELIVKEISSNPITKKKKKAFKGRLWMLATSSFKVSYIWCKHKFYDLFSIVSSNSQSLVCDIFIVFHLLVNSQQ